MNNKLVGISIGIVATVAFIIAGYFYVRNSTITERDAYWELKLKTAMSHRDSVWVYLKPDTVRMRIPSKPLLTDYQQKVDSAFNAGISKGADSLKRTFYYVAQPLDTLHVFSSGDTLADFYEPLTHDWRPTLYPAPRLAVYDTIYYPLPPITTNATLWQMGTAVAVGAIVFEGFRAFVLRKP